MVSLSGFSDSNSEDSQSQSLPHRLSAQPAAANEADVDSLLRLQAQQQQQQQPNLVSCLAAVACIFALSLPTEGEAADSVFQDFSWLHLTMTQKLVFAYVLGLVTMNILRTT